MKGLNLALLCVSATACGLVSMSLDDLSAGGGDASSTTTTPPTIDGSQLIPPGFEGGVIGPDGAIIPPGFDATTPPPDGGGGGPDGSQVVPDAADLCPVNPCSNGNVCCYVVKSANSGAFECMPSCPSGQPVECTGPQQCTGADPICCAKIALGAGSIPNCAIDGVQSRCAGSCTTNFALSCNAVDEMRLCHQPADCASDPQNKNCCTYVGSGVSAIICISDLIKGALGLSCL